MSQRGLKQVMRKICRVIYHVGVFEGSFPKILKGTQEYTRSHLVVLRDCLPDLKHLLRYAADTVPVVGRMMGLADRGTADLARASATLREVRRSTEAAVNEIFGVLDRVGTLLDRAARAERGDSETRQTLSEAREQLMMILNALQFQDITAQQIEATNALLSDLGKGLATLVEGLGEKMDDAPQIEVRAGTFDPNASFDRRRASVDQTDIDRLVDGEASARRGPERVVVPSGGDSQNEIPLKTPQAGGDGQSPASASQDDIDALLSGGGAASESAPKGASAGTVNQDDIDALLKG